jgi:hypothetical protein
MLLYVHLCLGVQWNHSCITTPFHVTLFTPMKANVMIVWLCLVIQDDGRSRVAGTAHNRAPSHDGGSIWLCLIMIRKSFELRPSGATRGKVENTEWEGRWVEYFHVWSSKASSPYLSRLRTDRWPRWASSIMYWRICDLWDPTNLVASMVAEVDDTLPYL